MNTNLRKILNMSSALATALVLAHCGSSGGGSAATPAGQGFVVAESGPALTGDSVRISSIDGEFSPNHRRELHVRSGDLVVLSADLYIGARGGIPAGSSPANFIWSSTVSPTDRCDLSLGGNCFGATNFQATATGVNFYVPYNIGRSIQIVVRSNIPGEVNSAGQPVYDTLVLNNMDFGGRPLTPAIITSAANYPAGQSFDPNVALAGMGNWVTVSGVRYFAPTAVVTPAIPVFQPYQNGYWATDSAQGFVWMSYDPWGWVTDHYGLWRHHATYGWIWSPFEDRHFEPAIVSWMNQGENLGWYPYSSRFDSFYAAHRAGFDDGFWLGISVELSRPEFHPGFAICPAREIGNPHLSGVLLAQGTNPAYLGFIQGSFQERHVFAFPGGNDWHSGLTLVNRFAHLPQTSIDRVPTHGGPALFMAKGINPVPKEAANLLMQARAKHEPIAIGSVLQDHNGHVEVTAPTRDGRGISPEMPPAAKGKVFDPNAAAPGARLPKTAPAAAPAPQAAPVRSTPPPQQRQVETKPAPRAHIEIEKPKAPAPAVSPRPTVQTPPPTKKEAPAPAPVAQPQPKHEAPVAQSPRQQPTPTTPKSSSAPTSGHRPQSEDRTPRENRG